MNIFTDIGILDILRIEPPFAVPLEAFAGSGIGRGDESYTTSIPRGDEAACAGIGRAAES